MALSTARAGGGVTDRCLMAETRGTRRAARSGGTKSTSGPRPKSASGTSRPKSTTRSGTSKSGTSKSGTSGSGTARSAAKTAARTPAKSTAKSRAKDEAATSSGPGKSTGPRPRESAAPPPGKSAATRAAPRTARPGRAEAPEAPAPSRLREIATEAAEELAALIGHEAEGVSAVRHGEQGWRVEVDVVEVHRIPDTTSLLATYELTLDEDGRLVGYRRLRRFRRGWADG
jgi:hypothetical protein